MHIVSRLLKALLAILTISYLSVKVPEVHRSVLRSYVSSKVVKIVTPNGMSGGTGFHVKAASGKTYILTNSHVCKVGKNNLVNVDFGGDRLVSRRIIEDSNYTDLCLIEGIPGVPGLSVGSEPEIGKEYSIVGHPELMPVTMGKGELIGSSKIQVLQSMFPEPGTCNLPKNKLIKIPFFLIEIPICLVEIEAYQSNIVILPGNSGSPLVDFFGRLVAVAFAGNDANWGSFVTHDDIVKFLKPY